MNKFEKLKKKLAEQNAIRSESPLEKWVKEFFTLCGIYDYATEYQVDYYFIDIAFPKIKFGVELDGKEFHQDKERDAKRDKYLQNAGWEILRIPSQECWNPKILAYRLKIIFKKVYPDRILTWGLAELLSCEKYLAPIAKTPELEFCTPCKEWHNLEFEINN